MGLRTTSPSAILAVKPEECLKPISPENHNCSQRQFGLILNYDQYGRIFSCPSVSGGNLGLIRWAC